jgi:hypothetical protein
MIVEGNTYTLKLNKKTTQKSGFFIKSNLFIEF